MARWWRHLYYCFVLFFLFLFLFLFRTNFAPSTHKVYVFYHDFNSLSFSSSFLLQQRKHFFYGPLLISLNFRLKLLSCLLIAYSSIMFNWTMEICILCVFVQLLIEKTFYGRCFWQKRREIFGVLVQISASFEKKCKFETLMRWK